MKRVLIALLLLIAAGAAMAAGEPATLCPNELREMIFKGRRHVVVDVQTPSDFAAHNYENSLPTAGDIAALKKLAAANASGDWPVVVVGSLGGREEEAALAILRAGGVASERLFILEGGMEAAVKDSGCGCCKVPEGSK